jgi:hypothetical protein
MKKPSRQPFEDRPLHIGVDFDNTIISYDDLFHRCALERGLIPEGLPKRKAAVRSHLWSLPDGNSRWTALQGEVYGSRINEAESYPGTLDFFSLCRKHRVRVTIVSHKAEFPALGPRVNLREAALGWLEAHGLPAGKGSAVFFEADRKAKVKRIALLECSHFIDDLPEVFADPSFPAGVEKLLFATEPPAVGSCPEDVRIFSDWHAITAYFGLI